TRGNDMPLQAIRRRDVIGLGVAAGAVFAWPLPVPAQRPERVLYVTHSAGFRHDSIPLSRAVLKALGETSGTFEVTATEEFSEFTAANLRRYRAVMFFTTGELPMSEGQKSALLGF